MEEVYLVDTSVSNCDLGEQLDLSFDFDFELLTGKNSVKGLDEFVTTAADTHQQGAYMENLNGKDSEEWLHEFVTSAANIHLQPKRDVSTAIKTQLVQMFPYALFDMSQVTILEGEFAKCQVPHDDAIRELASQLYVTTDQVKLWFDTRRIVQSTQLSNTPVHLDRSTSSTESISSSTVHEANEQKSRAPRTNFNENQLTVLEHAFQICPKPLYDTVVHLASELDLQADRVRVWFKNRRTKQRNLGNIRQPEHPPSSCNFVPPVPTRKSRADRTKFNGNQLAKLEHAFQECQYPGHDAIKSLASKIEVSVCAVKNWFTNRRAKQKKEVQLVQPQQLEQYDHTSSLDNHAMDNRLGIPNVPLWKCTPEPFSANQRTSLKIKISRIHS